MITPELQTYVRQQLGAGVGREMIKQNLASKGWKMQDVNEVFISIENPQTEQSFLPPTKSESHTGRWAIATIILILVSASGAYAAHYYNLITIPFLPVTTPAVPVATTTPTQSEPAPTATSTAITNNIKSEIDKYGVDLYILAQGTTVLEKTIDAKKFELTYTRTIDSVVRKVIEIGVSGGKTTLTSTIDLNSKDALLEMIKQIENEITANCNTTETIECTQSKKALSYLKTNCLSAGSNEERGTCIMTALLNTAK